MKGEKENKLKVIWKQVENVPEEEVQRRLNRAFGILFSKVKRGQNNKKQNKMTNQ